MFIWRDVVVGTPLMLFKQLSTNHVPRTCVALFVYYKVNSRLMKFSDENHLLSADADHFLGFIFVFRGFRRCTKRFSLHSTFFISS